MKFLYWFFGVFIEEWLRWTMTGMLWRGMGAVIIGLVVGFMVGRAA